MLLCAGCTAPLEHVFSTSGDAPAAPDWPFSAKARCLETRPGASCGLGRMGEILWTAELPHEVRLTPTVVRDTVVATTTGTDAAGFDAQTGARRWRLDLPRPAAALVGLGKTAYVLTEDGELLALDARTGALQSRTALATALGLHPPAPARLSLGWLPASGLLLSGPGAILLLGADTARRWRATVQGALGLLVQDGLLVTVDQSGQVLGLDLETGEARWQPSAGGQAHFAARLRPGPAVGGLGKPDAGGLSPQGQ